MISKNLAWPAVLLTGALLFLVGCGGEEEVEMPPPEPELEIGAEPEEDEAVLKRRRSHARSELSVPEEDGYEDEYDDDGESTASEPEEER